MTLESNPHVIPMRIAVDLNDPRPVYMQIVDAVRVAIVRGALQPGDQLPAIRETAVQARVNRNTVSRAYLELEHLDLVWARQGSGFYVSDGSRERERKARREALRRQVGELVVDAGLSGMTDDDLVELVRECAEEVGSEQQSDPQMEAEK